MLLKLKRLLLQIGQSQRDLAKHLELSPAAVTQIIKWGIYPKAMPSLQADILGFCRKHGASDAALINIFASEDIEPGKLSTAILTKEEKTMLLSKQTLSSAAKAQFKLFRNPFATELESADDVFFSGDARYVREGLWHTAISGGFIAVVGESGAGKTTLIRDLENNLFHQKKSVITIRPYVLGMEDNDKKGKTLKSAHIAEAIMTALAPHAKLRASPEARFRQLYETLRLSNGAGNAHCLIIDEAHALSIPTLKHLKRFYELELGFTKLLSIILVGQPELKDKLSEHNSEVREVVQRCEIIALAPLSSECLQDFLSFKLKRVGKNLSDVFEKDGIAALCAHLSFGARKNPKTGVAPSLLYPLVISNFLTACLNLCAELGAQRINPDIIKGV